MTHSIQKKKPGTLQNLVRHAGILFRCRNHDEKNLGFHLAKVPLRFYAMRSQMSHSQTPLHECRMDTKFLA